MAAAGIITVADMARVTEPRISGFRKVQGSCIHSFNMKTILQLPRLGVALALTGSIFANMSCMTTYDAYGRPVQSVDPAAAVAGAAAAGVLGYAIANSNNNDNHYYHAPPPRRGYYHRSAYHGRGYYR